MRTAKEVYQVLECEGLTRVDVFLTEGNQVIINEINTLPGFTKISMYPSLIAQMGISAKALMSKLIDLAMEKHDHKNALKVRV